MVRTDLAHAARIELENVQIYVVPNSASPFAIDDPDSNQSTILSSSGQPVSRLKAGYKTELSSGVGLDPISVQIPPRIARLLGPPPNSHKTSQETQGLLSRLSEFIE